jgi:uncharacterized protein YndB with AHSA1/START domain
MRCNSFINLKLSVMLTLNQTIITTNPDKQELIIAREFDAPRELVFKAYIDSKLLTRWLGPKNYAMTVDKNETRNGGSWRFVHIDPQGNKFGFHGVFHEITAPERIIRTSEYEELPEAGHVSLETVKFQILDGDRTKVITHDVFLNVTDRDGMIQSDMERGINESYERLDELLRKL